MRAFAPVLAAATFLLLPLAFIEPNTYVTLTVGGLAMGMLIFLVASGLTLIFGLMDVLNFAHGALFSWGAYVGFSVVLALDRRWGWAASPSLALNLLLLLLAIVAATLVALVLGVLLARGGKGGARPTARSSARAARRGGRSAAPWRAPPR